MYLFLFAFGFVGCQFDNYDDYRNYGDYGQYGYGYSGNAMNL